MFGQTFDLHDLAIIGLLVVLEGVLSIDNALVLGLLAKRLPKRLQSKGLTYGLVGAFVFRVVAIATASYLLHWGAVKLAGGLYLIYVSVKHFFFEGDDAGGGTGGFKQPVAVTPDGNVVGPDCSEDGGRKCASFWPTVAVIELTDIAFAVDSILAAIAVIPSAPPHRTNPKLWVVLVGGMLGVILMRFAAVVFIRLLERFPRFETSAYLLVFVIGVKLLADWWFNADPEHPDWRFNFHSYHSPGFWAFWVTMLAFFCVGFIPVRGGKPAVQVVEQPPADGQPPAAPAAPAAPPAPAAPVIPEPDRDEVHTS